MGTACCRERSYPDETHVSDFKEPLAMMPDNLSSCSGSKFSRRRKLYESKELGRVEEEDKESDFLPIYKVDAKLINRCERHYNVDFDPLSLKRRIDGHFVPFPDKKRWDQKLDEPGMRIWIAD